MKRSRVDKDGRNHCSADAWKTFTHVLLLISGSLLFLLSGRTCVAQQNGKNVLFLFSSVKYSEEIMNLVEPAVRARAPGSITFYDAYLDDPQIEEQPYRESVSETFRQRYAGLKLDVVVVCNSAALSFAVEYRDKIFPNVPIVFMGISSNSAEDQRSGPAVTGFLSPLGFRETIDLALRLQPDTKAIAIIAGTTRWDSRWLRAIHSELLSYQNRVEEIDLVGPPNRQMVKRVAALPLHTVAFLQIFPQFSNHEQFGTWDLVTEVAKRVPTYSVFERICLEGCIGGAFYDYRKEWLLAAQLVARVLSGERVENIPVVRITALRDTVDWRALHRWHIPESALPAGTLIMYREPTLWESYHKYIVAVIALILAQALLIASLLWQRARKRKAEAVLRESEERFRVMADTTPSLVWMCDSRGKIIYQNERRIAFTGLDPKIGWADCVHPDDVQNRLDTVSQAMKTHRPFSTEYRMRRTDGTYRWMLDVASPRLNGDGSFAGFIGSAIDTTDQILAKQALEKISGQLIEAQEQERSRIARELHDDICQRLALLSMEIEQANPALDGSPEDTKNHLEEIGELCREIGRDVQSLSHQLHSSILDCLGIATAIRGFCDELSKQHDVSIDFTERNVRKHLPRDVSLCLFRIAQEALHNALKYSGVREFTVELSESAGTVQLLVRDRGEGFAVEEANKKGGLGLVSMQERAHLVHGAFSVDSAPGEGTRILVTVPLRITEQRYSVTTSSRRLQVAGL